MLMIEWSSNILQLASLRLESIQLGSKLNLISLDNIHSYINVMFHCPHYPKFVILIALHLILLTFYNSYIILKKPIFFHLFFLIYTCVLCVCHHTFYTIVLKKKNKKKITTFTKIFSSNLLQILCSTHDNCNQDKTRSSDWYIRIKNLLLLLY